jgi:hypothetical protein
MNITATFRESASANPWAIIGIPITANVIKKNKRAILSETYQSPVCIPAKGHLGIVYRNAEVASFEYFVGIPHAESLENLAAVPNDLIWVQMNDASARFVVQIQLQKLAPEFAKMSTDGTMCFVYGVRRLAVHLPIIETDKLYIRSI